jgi:integrase
MIWSTAPVSAPLKARNGEPGSALIATGARIEQSKGRKDRNVMLSQETLGLLRQWWKAHPSRYDAGTPVAERWLFPGNRRGKPMTTRQLSRLFHQAAEAAGIKKAVTLHALRHSFAPAAGLSGSSWASCAVVTTGRAGFRRRRSCRW